MEVPIPSSGERGFAFTDNRETENRLLIYPWNRVSSQHPHEPAQATVESG
jgi:hypothetical protein